MAEEATEAERRSKSSAKHLGDGSRASGKRPGQRREAGHAARREFGKCGIGEGVTREVRGGRVVRDIAIDARYDNEDFVEESGITIVAILSQRWASAHKRC